MNTTEPLLLKFLELGDTREVPVGALDVLGEAHDVVTMAVASRTDHAVQHVLVVKRGGRVADEEESSGSGQVAEGHGLTDDLVGLGLLEPVTCRWMSREGEWGGGGGGLMW